MRKCILFLVIVFLTACSQSEQQSENHPSEHTETIIDWVDFIKIDDKQYEVLYTAAIADTDYIGDEIGKVKFKVNDNINDANYRIKNGDAAFWKEGTKIYSVKEKPELIAVRDKQAINGYRLYQNESSKEKWSFDHVNQDSIQKIEIWEGAINLKHVNTVKSEEKIERLLAILKESSIREDDKHEEEEPDYYDIVFYQDSSIANHYPLIHQKDEWYWLPWEEEVLSDDIKEFIDD